MQEKENTQKENKYSKFVKTFMFVLFIFGIGYGISCIDTKILLLSTGIFSLLMYFNISFTTLANAFIGRDINPNYDIFWKMLFIITTSLTLGIYFNI